MKVAAASNGSGSGSSNGRSRSSSSGNSIIALTALAIVVEEVVYSNRITCIIVIIIEHI